MGSFLHSEILAFDSGRVAAREPDVALRVERCALLPERYDIDTDQVPRLDQMALVVHLQLSVVVGLPDLRTPQPLTEGWVTGNDLDESGPLADHLNVAFWEEADQFEPILDLFLLPLL